MTKLRKLIDLSNIELAKVSEVRLLLHLGLAFAKVEVPPDRETSLGFAVQVLRSSCEQLYRLPYTVFSHARASSVLVHVRRAGGKLPPA
jgi:hypothetical protein